VDSWGILTIALLVVGRTLGVLLPVGKTSKSPVISFRPSTTVAVDVQQPAQAKA
jgi:hypothetical protein